MVNMAYDEVFREEDIVIERELRSEIRFRFKRDFYFHPLFRPRLVDWRIHRVLG